MPWYRLLPGKGSGHGRNGGRRMAKLMLLCFGAESVGFDFF